MSLIVELVGIFEKLGVVGTGISATATACVALGFKKWGWPRVRKMGAGISRFCHGIASIGQLQATVDKIHKEVVPNGGSSLRDAVNRTELALTVFINTTRAQWDGMGMFGICEFNPEGELTYANGTYLKWVNRPEPAVLGSGWINCLVPRDRARVRAEWESCVDDQREFRCDYTLVREDGTELNVTGTRTPVSERPNGPVLKWVGLVQRRGETK